MEDFGQNSGQHYSNNLPIDRLGIDLPRRRIASSLEEFSKRSFDDCFSESMRESMRESKRENKRESKRENYFDSFDSFNSFDETIRNIKSSPRFHMKPVHTLAIMFVLVVALCASLTMLISQSLTYQRVQNSKSESLQKIEDNADYSKHSFDDLEDSNSKKNNKNGESDYGIESSESGESSESDESIESSERSENGRNGQSRRSRKSRKSKSASNKSDTFRININTATVDQLQSLKGIGPKTAARIIAHRKRVGGFNSLEDLLQIKGIGPKTLNKFRGNVEVK
ncbi:ComEA family DNA-binding protein [Gardnerella greenwoodii]|uniref:Competence protein ComEA n=1 Tax=Gardnerella greenwoodii TaxID=2914925 RepID=A0A2N6RXD3_9BIFI|nr:helix-hairpin-helix domain-containing protein [Gardnerella greenwoodii]MDF0753673.1 helix-hairpin-helix domain-containing protein [Gardnerella greenwoodii]PMC42775.1 competence protein ComEA [Gardnerella greenwoodii]